MQLLKWQTIIRGQEVVYTTQNLKEVMKERVIKLNPWISLASNAIRKGILQRIADLREST